MTDHLTRRGVLAGIAALPAARAALAASPMGIARGPVRPDWPSLVAHHRYPDWFRDAKLGIWAHWGPQSVPAQGDWYGRLMYMQGHPIYEHHLKTYGHPSVVGMKDIQHLWKAERWNPAALIARYQKAGARYFMALACHHDNFDCYDSRYHAWNSVGVGPRRDVVGMWERAARAAGLKFGVSNHAAHSWHWYQPAYGYDAVGPMRGVRYDAARLTRADGRGQWWDGLDPQALYNHAAPIPSDGLDSIAALNRWYDDHSGGSWEEQEAGPKNDPAYAARWLLRQQDLVARYKPDLVYMDDTGLPFGPIGLQAAADYYNRSIAWHGDVDVALFAKKLRAGETGGVIEDVERGFADHVWDVPWQTDTCIGDWFYNVARLRDRSYKTAEQVVQRLCDVVSKNGNLLLSIPLPGDGMIDDEETKILDAIGAWTATNGEAIFGSRPWKRFGEGPTQVKAGSMNEGSGTSFTSADVRFTTNKGALYAAFLAWPDNSATVASLAAGRWGGHVERATLLGGGTVGFHRDGEGIHFELPPRAAGGLVPVLRLEGPGVTA